jgi:hypothetical protein
MQNKNNTFGNYKFPKWVPKETQESIIKFWGQGNRNYKHWIKSCKEQNEREKCQHGPGPNGFGMPPYGARAEYFIYDHETSKEKEMNMCKMIEGRYIHRWNNMGSLIDDTGNIHYVSTCDRWLRIYTSEKEKEESILKQREE